MSDQVEKKPSFFAVMRAVRRHYPGLILTSCLVNLLLLVTAIYMLQIYDRVLSSGSLDTLVWLSVIAAIAIAAYGLLEQSRRLVLSRAAGFVDDSLNAQVLERSMMKRLSGDTDGAGVRDVTDLRGFYESDAALSFLDAPWSAVFIAFVWMLHPVLGAIAFGGAVVLFMATLANDLMTRQRQKKAAGAAREAQEAAIRFVDGGETIAPLGMARALFARWRQTHGAARAEQRSLTETTLTILNFTKALRLMLQVSLLGVGAYFVLAGSLTPGAMIAASIIGGRALSPIERLTSGWRKFVAARAARARLAALFRGIEAETASVSLPRPSGRIAAEDLVYVPPRMREPVLERVAFDLEPGEACAIVGPSGAGKSTLCRLLIGAWKPTAGHVRLDGADVYDWNSEELGAFIGYLPQKVELFPGTVAENIARFQELDSTSVIEAARRAGVHELILSLPHGYETPVGGSDTALSLGQAQRIGLARALYGNPSFVVLDEPNSNLDQAGDRALLGAVQRMKALGVTVVVVSHRPEILKSIDKVLVLKEGRVARFGAAADILRPAKPAPAAAKVKPGQMKLTIPDDKRPTSVAGE